MSILRQTDQKTEVENGPGMVVGDYHFRCTLTREALLPAYKGSTFRGVFGHSLKRVVCTFKNKECHECLLNNRCLYAKIFIDESTFDPEQKGAPSIPKPYVIKPPKTINSHMLEGDAFDFHLLLFGDVNKELPYFVYAFSEIGNLGIGKRIDGHRAGFVVNEILHNEEVIYTDEEKTLTGGTYGNSVGLGKTPAPKDEPFVVQVFLETPLRLKFGNHLQADLPFHVLIRAALRRISTLFNQYGEGEPDLDYKGLVKRAQEVEAVDSNLHWYDWKRYSNRQDKSMLMGGISGSVDYFGKLEEFLPILRLAELLHVGKQTTFGLGEFRMEVMR
ncbi:MULTISPECIES: CRISPR system precrRNA processing endoribonuclease RAMP protein Cas6 [Desulfatibacillum]|jgi:hypothetical protein|uniref:Uncharacterized conserved protein n=1 Tax=Desulfatibacillum alkenivorans DSM 16219 TaxID=1121393 RepID=A0A1M6QT36_9BACT|nr:MULTISPECIES: CRISPR system precrRNA processing endoribonuclease RAMP protein Cas6 [Desulfatibacillum]SHK23187.1 Uncharacterized conserved protein [Desulfatibacillum alkenivorans DSM 16219]